jgi:hypothetical protein
MTNILYLLMAGTNIFYPALSPDSDGMMQGHDAMVVYEASPACFADLRDGYTAASFDGVNVVCDGVVYAPFVPLPAQFPNGITIPGDDEHWYKPVVIDGALEPIQISNSPLDPETAKQMEAEGKASRRAAKQAERLRQAAALRVSQMTAQATITGALELIEIADLFNEWQSGIAVKAGELYRHDGGLWRVVQAHTTQADWKPASVPALFVRVAEPGTVAAWKQPAGAHDAYQIGARVTHKGFTWQSTAANNVWEPGVFGWSKQ